MVWGQSKRILQTSSRLQSKSLWYNGTIKKAAKTINSERWEMLSSTLVSLELLNRFTLAHFQVGVSNISNPRNNKNRSPFFIVFLMHFYPPPLPGLAAEHKIVFGCLSYFDVHRMAVWLIRQIAIACWLLRWHCYTRRTQPVFGSRH